MCLNNFFIHLKSRLPIDSHYFIFAGFCYFQRYRNGMPSMRHSEGNFFIYPTDYSRIRVHSDAGNYTGERFKFQGACTATNIRWINPKKVEQSFNERLFVATQSINKEK